MAKSNNSYHDLTDKVELEKEELKSKINKLRVETEILKAQKSSQAKEQDAKIIKLEKENKVLDNQLSKKAQWQESIKAYASAASILTAIFTLFAVYGSFRQLSTTAKLTLDSRKEDRLNSALANLADTSVRKKLVGIIALRSFIKEGDSLKNTQALLSLSQTLAVEDNPTIRNSILDVFRSNEIKSVDTITLKNVLTSLVNFNREFVERIPEIKYLYSRDSLKESTYSVILKANATSKAIAHLLRQRIFVKDLANLYLQNVDLSNIKFPNKTDFSNSSLVHSNFDSVRCQSCIFNNANLVQAEFINANLKGSLFVSNNDYYEGNFITESLRISKAFSQIRDCVTYFNYADLRGAKFHNFPMLTIKDNESIPFSSVDFQHTKLAKTKFSKIVFCFVKSHPKNLTDEMTLFFNQPSYWIPYTNTDLAIHLGYIDDDTKIRSLRERDNIVDGFVVQFVGADWPRADFPKVFAKYIKINPPGY